MSSWTSPTPNQSYLNNRNPSSTWFFHNANLLTKQLPLRSSAMPGLDAHSKISSIPRSIWKPSPFTGSPCSVWTLSKTSLGHKVNTTDKHVSPVLILYLVLMSRIKLGPLSGLVSTRPRPPFLKVGRPCTLHFQFHFSGSTPHYVNFFTSCPAALPSCWYLSLLVSRST